MPLRLRSALFLSLAAVAVGCSSSHMSTGDDAGPRTDAPGSDAATCIGIACPAPRCSDDIDPWASPGTACSVEGARCSNNGGVCGSVQSCDCEMGHWRCLVAEPDPVCWCGRQPMAGDRCASSGSTCGECCPTVGGPGWPAMTCVDGLWQPGNCADVLCEEVQACPVSREAALGTACRTEGLSCGNACCDLGFVCSGGVWEPGPPVDCAFCDPSQSFSCGIGTCERGQACTSSCGPTDGIEHSCTVLPAGCTSCDCVTVPDGYRCEARGGTVFFEMLGFCG